MLHTDNANLSDAEQVDEIIFQSISAQDAYVLIEQEAIDTIVSHIARAAHSEHLHLARMVAKETGGGIVEDKSTANMYASSGLELKLRSLATVGVIEERSVDGYQVIAEPIGILAAFPPLAHPVATIVLQAILSVKTRNPIVFCFHPSVQKSSVAAAQLVQEAATKAGAPPHAIQWLVADSGKSVPALLQNPEISCILMDGENMLLSSESLPDIPMLGTGIMNTPCLIDRSADIERAATDVVSSRYFDNGLVSIAEQTVIISREVYFQTLDLMMQKSCHLANEQEKELLEDLLFDPESGVPNLECTGRDAVDIAEMAGFTVPGRTKLILVELGGIGPLHPLSRPKDVPVLSVLACETSYEGLCFCEAILDFSTSSLAAVLHARDKTLIAEFTDKLKVIHALVNRPATRGDLGEFITFPGSNLTTAADRQAGNVATAPLCLDLLLSRKLVQAPKIRKRQWKVPEQLFYSPDSILQLQTMQHMKRTLIVTENGLVDSEAMDKILLCLNAGNYPVKTDFFCSVGDVPNIVSIEQGVQCMEEFRPTALLAVGNSCAMDTAKVMNYFYHRFDDAVPQQLPDLESAGFPVCSEDVRKKQVILVTVPCMPGSGAEVNGVVTLFSKTRDRRRTLQSCDLIPDVSLIDSTLIQDINTKDLACAGMNILSHALEAYVSPLASDYSDSMAMNAIRLILKNLEKAVNSGSSKAKEKVYNAAAMAGMASSNAKTGLNLAMTHSLLAMFRISPDLGANLLLPHVIRFNGVEDPSRFNPLTPGSRYAAHERYQEIAGNLGLPCKSPEQSVDSLVNVIQDLQRELQLPRCISDCGINEQEFLSKVDKMVEQVFDDHSTLSNPRLPLLTEIETLFKQLQV